MAPDPEEAFERWIALCARAGVIATLAPELIPLVAAHGRSLTRPVTALRTEPSSDCAAMDGIALRAAEAAQPIPALQFALIDTGQPIPPGFDAVCPHERVSFEQTAAIVTGPVSPGDSIRRAGESFRTGDELLAEGARLTPYALALAASAGHVELEVRRRPHVTVIPTGDELRPLGAAEGVIETNSLMVRAQAEECGAQVTIRATIADDRAWIAEAVSAASHQSDLVLLLSGSSAGRRDHAHAVLDEIGEIAVAGVGMRPGHPVILAAGPAAPVIALPGYPVAAALAFRLFGVRLIRWLLGHSAPGRGLLVELAEPIEGHASATLLVPVQPLADGRFAPLPRRSSALASLANASAVVTLAPGSSLAAGDLAVADPLP